MNEFPKALYKPGSQWRVECGVVDVFIAKSEEEQSQALSDGWMQTPEQAAGLVPIAADQPSAYVPQAAQQTVTMTREDMIAALEAAGVDVDKRWGDKRLAAEMAKLKG